MNKFAIITCIVYLVVFSLLTTFCKNNDPHPVPNTNQGNSGTGCIKTNCSNYSSQASAQADFDADSICHTDLDADNDGIACEEPGNSVTICPTTSACGCSGYTKANCVGPCCKWVVGTGCVCK